ncbi:MAG: S8 family serine peptidase [Actinomycetota bacterium]|nr:S8 family serine peptidase [Actinomycetota bacterium]
MRRPLLALIAGAGVWAVTVLSTTVPAAAAPGPGNSPEYWFDSWHLTQLWSDGARGQGITIAEIDTGVNAALPELAANVVPGTDLGNGGDGRTDREVNTFGHGTAMASIMVAQPGVLGITGIAPDARILPIAVPLTGTTDADNNDHLAQAIRYAADHGAKIISMSLGGTRKPTFDEVPCPADEQSAIYYALGKGSVLVASSGNNGLRGSAVEEPGVCLGVISVGAVDQSGTVADFSSRHPYLTITAPGVNVPSLSRVPGSAFAGDGTSQATAIASAVMAIVWSHYPTDTAAQVTARILDTLDRRTSTRDPAYGYGTINAEAAVLDPVAATASDPVYSAAAPFIERGQGFAASHLPTPPSAGSPTGSLGVVRIGNTPRLIAPHVLEGLSIAGAGLLALVVLGLVGWRRRRRGPPVVTGTGSRVEPVEVPALANAIANSPGIARHTITDPDVDGTRELDSGSVDPLPPNN